MNLGKATLLRRGPRSGGGLTTSVPNNVERFMDNRRGYARLADGGYGPAMTTIVVENTNLSGPGSLAEAMAAAVNKYIIFKPGLSGTIGTDGTTADSSTAGSRKTYKPAGLTIVDGTGFSGLIYGAFIPQNVRNLVFMYCSVTQPWPYTGDPSGPVISASNCDNVYYYHCTVWDSGDVLFTAGAYQLTPNRAGDMLPPYRITLDSCWMGPNPGRYAMMAPIRGTNPDGYQPGQLNPIDNDARNGKVGETAYDHTWIEGNANQGKIAHPEDMVYFNKVTWVTMVNNVLSGGVQRNLKTRSQNLHAYNNIVAKFGGTQGMGGAQYMGGGSAFQDDARARYFGNVYIPYKTGEYFVGFQPAAAVPLGKSGLVVTSPTPKLHQRLGFNTGDIFFGGNWMPTEAQIGYALSIDTAPSTTGLDYTDTANYGYSATEIDVSGITAAKALVKKLCDTDDTKAGNPYCVIKPPHWRDVDTTNFFPVT